MYVPIMIKPMMTMKPARALTDVGSGSDTPASELPELFLFSSALVILIMAMMCIINRDDWNERQGKNDHSE